MTEIQGLGYIVVEATQPARWKAYAEQVLGMVANEAPGAAPGAAAGAAAGDAPGGALYLKMDERQYRVLVLPGERDRYLASGWELADAAAFEAALARLQAHGVAVARADPLLRAQRRVQALAVCQDPSGNTHELYWGFQSDFRRFVSPVGVPRFVTGAIGMGHTVLPAPAFDDTERFFVDALGFRLSDIFNFRPPGTEGVVLPIRFFHCANGRHHSLALAGFPVESGCVHVMLEVDDVPEVGRAMDRMRAHGVVQSATLGQHTNDRMISFYMRSPGNFDIEFGCGGAVVDWSTHIVHEFTEVSLWGHDFSVSQQQLLNNNA
jgi:3,4-dihydroxy-9,10-secoandrosta-1,3,5(10)-triene-9,17-dione 4,5-dioxygenase